MAVTLLECLPEARPFARVPPASTGGHEIMLIKHIEQRKKKQHCSLVYLYGRCRCNVVKYFSAKMYDDEKIRGIKLSEFVLIVSFKNCSLEMHTKLYTKVIFKRNNDSSEGIQWTNCTFITWRNVKSFNSNAAIIEQERASKKRANERSTN